MIGQMIFSQLLLPKFSTFSILEWPQLNSATNLLHMNEQIHHELHLTKFLFILHLIKKKSKALIDYHYQ